jgi:hypothetical protein
VSFDPGVETTLASLAGFAVVSTAEVDHEAPLASLAEPPLLRLPARCARPARLFGRL